MTSSELPSALPRWITEHIELYRTDPDRAHYWDASMGGGKGMLPTLLLTTQRRKSGGSISLPLIYKRIGKAWVIVASKGGAPDHPAWYYNLAANPAVTLQAGREIVQATARTVSGAERDTMWKEMAELYPPYNDYQRRAGQREIPVVALEAD